MRYQDRGTGTQLCLGIGFVAELCPRLMPGETGDWFHVPNPALFPSNWDGEPVPMLHPRDPAPRSGVRHGDWFHVPNPTYSIQLGRGTCTRVAP